MARFGIIAGRRPAPGVVVAVASLGLVATVASAARADMVVSEDKSNYGRFSQLNSGVAGTEARRTNSCVPAAVANGLYFLGNTYGLRGIANDGYGEVNALAVDMKTSDTGTSYENAVRGTAAYIGPDEKNISPPVIFAGGQITALLGYVPAYNIANGNGPSPSQLYDWLTENDAVEIAINWEGGGVHFVSLYGISIQIDKDGHATGKGTLSFFDPFGGPAEDEGNDASAVDITAATFDTIDGRLFIDGGYTGGAANNGADPDNLARSNTGTIVGSFAQGVVPAPPSLVLLATALAPIGLTRVARLVVARRPPRSAPGPDPHPAPPIPVR